MFIPERSLRRALIALSLSAAACESNNPSPDVAVTVDASRDVSQGEASCGPCSIWQVRCGDRCVDPTVSTTDCGACGVRCDPSRQVCQGGVCADAARCAMVSAGSLGTPRDAGVDASVDASREGGTTDAATPRADASNPVDAARDSGVSTGIGLRGEYYASNDLTNLKVVRLDPSIDFNWDMTAPHAMVPRENFSVRWLGALSVERTGMYTLITTSDDGVRLWVDGVMLVDDWTGHGATDNTAMVALTAGTSHAIRVEYYQGTGTASMRLSWIAPDGMRELLPTGQLQPQIGDAYGCANGECCPTASGRVLCCPRGSRCVNEPSFNGCCPDGQRCDDVPMCPAG